MKLKTSELTAPALDWAVMQCEGLTPTIEPDGYLHVGNVQWRPSRNWQDGGPIIEREGISVAADTAGMFDSFVWFASVDDILVDADEAIGVRGPTPLIAAMRCYVKAQLGDEVEVPDELV